ncbi:hypothetical protein EK21DRAFT_81436 [Setomelanomma holmii]|uniref:Uncharacterized protein n=1 Tax=Setomelanomma holmii TaxID=210430 RepID=A0A9P4GXC2_9PLEO|nr:hypothetical protein EK21DRAFT_81436 [Setomelanomma holmii]
MPRPCQRRRESATAKRKSTAKPKPSGPPPIRHKARQKAVHNARHGRSRGGRPSQNQRSGNGLEANQDFISFASSGNNFNVLNGAGSRQNPIALGDDDSLEDGEISEDGSDEDDDSDEDMDDAEALTINVQVQNGYKGRPGRARVMFSVVEAISVYKELHGAGFPLSRQRVKRYGREIEESYARPAHPPAAALPVRGPVALSHSSTATSHASAGGSQAQDAARDYTFDWGVHSGKSFKDVPENYLKTIAGNPSLLDKHPEIKEAFDFHRPGMRRTAPTSRQKARQQQSPVQAPTRQGRAQGSRGTPKVSWTNFKLPTGAHVGKKLNEVPENYLKTIEGMDHVMNKWVGLKEALHDYNVRTGRQGKVAG